jgi:hypothetical protein
VIFFFVLVYDYISIFSSSTSFLPTLEELIAVLLIPLKFGLASFVMHYDDPFN